jgi:hypothetical protein
MRSPWSVFQCVNDIVSSHKLLSHLLPLFSLTPSITTETVKAYAKLSEIGPKHILFCNLTSRFSALSQNCEMRPLALSCLSVCPHGTTQLLLNGFSLHLILRYFRKSVENFFFSWIHSPIGPGPPLWGSSITLGQTTLLWTSDRLVAETSTWQHTTLTRDRRPCLQRDSNPQSLDASGRRTTPWPCGHWDRLRKFECH